MANQTSRVKLAWYGAVVFLSSAILLVLEITAGRLIAPYVGVTIYSWTSIIGVILAGLSLGNWIGGRWADRGASERSTGIALALAAVFSLASLLALTLVAPTLQASEIDLVSARFLYVLSMFFLPSLLLGIPTPLLTTNVVDAFPDPKMVKCLVDTLRAVFAEVDIWLDEIPGRPQRMTYVISASERPIGGDVLRARSGIDRRWLRINQPLARSGTPFAELPLFSDDFVPVERMISSQLLGREGL